MAKVLTVNEVRALMPVPADPVSDSIVAFNGLATTQAKVGNRSVTVSGGIWSTGGVPPYDPVWQAVVQIIVQAGFKVDFSTQTGTTVSW